jgi:glyoxylase-like metal-dependent hydrolase (beta-lactamase superfamily II)
MALVVDRYVLGAAQENCYAVRLDRGAADAAVIDPGDGAAQLRLELAGMGAHCAAILTIRDSSRPFSLHHAGRHQPLPQLC